MSGIERFVKEQKQNYDIALSEIKSGWKRSHWMWYIFPQLKGLGMTSTADYYGINDIGEAREYLSDEYLENNLKTISNALLDLEESDPEVVLGYPDNLKLRSCMTLFYYASENEDAKAVFKAVIDKYYNGEFDYRTEEMLGV